jgi:hypothetical protein
MGDTLVRKFVNVPASNHLPRQRASRSLSICLRDSRQSGRDESPSDCRAFGNAEQSRAYDAVRVALAEPLGAPPLTPDRRLATAAGYRTIIDLV